MTIPKTNTKAITTAIISGTTLLSFLASMAACTKTLPYQTVLKEQVYSKSTIDTSAEYLYVPSTGSVSRTADNTQPFMSGSEKIVKLVFTQTALQAYEIERDPNFKANPQNSKLVFEIPVSHIDYRCQLDRLNNCKNQEEENTQLTWDQKASFKPDFSKLNVAEVNDMPDSIAKILGKDNCMSDTSDKVLDYEFAADHINFKMERTFTAGIQCIGSGMQSLSDLTTTMVANYHLVKLNTVTSSDYQAVNYPTEDENTFGFFKTAQNLTDVDNALRTNGEVRMMNRWNPNRTEVVYYLSDEFNKPENQSLKLAAHVAFDKLNNGLKSAGAKFHLNLKDPAGLNPGDIRNSMIILVEDPVGGLLGYGPVTANPKTGEIISGRVAMFSGTMKSSARVSYEEIRNLKIAAKISGQAAALQQMKAANLSTGSVKLTKNNLRLNRGLKKMSVIKGASPLNSSSQSQFLNKSGLDTIKTVLNPNNFKNMKSNSLESLMANRHSCVYPSGMTEANTKVVVALTKQFSDDMKPWEDLTAEEKQAALDIIMPELFEPVLIHEMGHNLGLRHNFSGSEDQANFYTKDELKAMGVDYAIPYSSVMDYGASDLNVLPTLGKYDIAALKFAYGRQLAAKDGTALSLKSTDTIQSLKKAGTELADFKFCTDEAAEINAGCKRFDEGTSNVAIVDSIIERYHESIRMSGSRRGRENFSMMDDVAYAQRINAIFYDLRTFMEVVERIKYRAGVADDAADWNSIPEIKDLHDAAIKAGNFLISVLAMPETTCVIGDSADPTKAPQVVPLSAIDSSAIQCLGFKMKGTFVILGQAGRPFLDKKDPASNNPYVDQIDVRGMWIDKIIAAKYLFTRKIQETKNQPESLFDENSDSFYNLPQLRDSMMSTLTAIMTDNLVSNVDVVRPDGSTFKMDIPLDITHSHVIPKHMDPSVSHFLLIPDRDTHFIEILGQRIERQNSQSLNRDPLAKQLLDTVGVYKTPAVFGAPVGSVNPLTINGKMYAATEDNIVAGIYSDQVVLTKVQEALTAEAKDQAGLVKLLNKLFAVRKAKTTPAAPAPGPAPAPAAGTPATPTPPAVDPADSLTNLDKAVVAMSDDQFASLVGMIKSGADPVATRATLQQFMEMLPELN